MLAILKYSITVVSDSYPTVLQTIRSLLPLVPHQLDYFLGSQAPISYAYVNKYRKLVLCVCAGNGTQGLSHANHSLCTTELCPQPPI